MRIAASGAGTGVAAQTEAPRQEAQPARIALPAVVPLRDAAKDRPRPRPLADSALLAQLAATAQDHPATRARRRADPALSTATYRSVAGLRQPPPATSARFF
jgi:hypothetical protein